MKKIIHIYHRAYDAICYPVNSDAYYLDGWGSLVARYTLKYTKKYLIENWRPEINVQKPQQRKVEGILCRLFPSTYIRHFGDWSSAMLKELIKETKKNEILIHHCNIHSNLFYLIAFLFRNIPIVAQQHGDSPPLIRFRRTKRPTTLLTHFIERAVLRNVDHFFVLRKWEREFLSRFLFKSKITSQTMGVNFDEFKPIDKKLARKKLGLSQNKKIILYVGKFYKLKGVDIILKVFQNLKKRYDVELILIGGSPKDPLYEDVRISGARFYGYLPHDELPLYFSAADVYLLPAFLPEYAGIDVATIESLACGTPIVSTTLNDFPTDEWKALGKIPTNEEDVVKCVVDIFENPELFKNCREIAKKYYDWEIIINRTVRVYDILFEEYYANKRDL